MNGETLMYKLILPLLVFFGCAASVSTEQYVGEYEKQKSLDEIEVTKVDGLKLYDLKFNKELEERYPALAEKEFLWVWFKNYRTLYLTLVDSI